MNAKARRSNIGQPDPDMAPVKAPVGVTNAARNPTNDDIITSTFVHVLSAFAIAEAQ